MFNYNHITLVGRVTNDPVKEVIDETTKVKFTLAIDRPYRKDDGTTEADFIHVIIYGKLADVALQYLKKARPVLVEGRIQIRQTKCSQDENSYNYTTEVVAENFQVLESLKK